MTHELLIDMQPSSNWASSTGLVHANAVALPRLTAAFCVIWLSSSQM